MLYYKKRTNKGEWKMPPHCDSKDGPVVKAAQKALEAGNVDLILPFVKQDGEKELRQAFELALEARKAGGAAQRVADEYFFETAVRIHRRGEGAPFTGLKPAGLDVGPVIPVAERAIDSGNPEKLTELLVHELTHQIHHRLTEVQELKASAGQSVPSAREYTEAMLGLQVWSHSLYTAMRVSAHEGQHEHS
jgi:hypothetical protein